MEGGRVEVRAVWPNESSDLLVEAYLIEDPGIGERAEDLSREHWSEVHDLSGSVLETYSEREGRDLLEARDCVYCVAQAVTSAVQS